MAKATLGHFQNRSKILLLQLIYFRTGGGANPAIYGFILEELQPLTHCYKLLQTADICVRLIVTIIKPVTYL